MGGEVNSNSSYKSIFKANSLFGGVQVFQIIISVLKSKVLAYFLGPYGIGIQGLYQSSVDLVKQVTSMGLSTSAVKDISEAKGQDDTGRLTLVANAFKRIVWFTGAMGMVSMIIFSPLLSNYSFDSSDYIPWLCVLSVVLFLDQICSGQKAMLQGTRELKLLAKASIIGSSIGLLVCIPLCYFWGIDAIVPMLIANSLVSLFVSWYFSNKIKIPKIKISNKECFDVGKQMIKMGVALTITSTTSSVVALVLKSYINIHGGAEQVGLYMAGFMIMESYVGLVFNAIGSDYYPRLASVNHDNIECTNIVNKQGEVGFLILMPLLVCCLVYMPFVIKLLYTSEFLAAYDFIMWAVLGILFKFGAWLISFLFVAKSDVKFFVTNELIAKVYIFILNIAGYSIWGVMGLGVSFALGYFVYFIHMLIIGRIRYQISFVLSFRNIFITSLSFVFATFILMYLFPSHYRYLLGTTIAVGSILLSLFLLDKRVGLINSLKSRMTNK